MMNPEMMKILAKSRQEYLQSLASGDPFMSDARNLTRSLRNVVGRGMVRAGRWIEGHRPTAIQPEPGVKLQEP